MTSVQLPLSSGIVTQLFDNAQYEADEPVFSVLLKSAHASHFLSAPFPVGTPPTPLANDSVWMLEDASFFPLSNASDSISRIVKITDTIMKTADRNHLIALVMSRGIDGGALSSINQQHRNFRSIAQFSRNMSVRVNIYKSQQGLKRDAINVSHSLWSNFLTDGSRHMLHLQVNDTTEHLHIVFARYSGATVFYTLDGTTWTAHNRAKALFDLVPIGLMVGFSKDYMILENSPSIAYS